MSYDFGMRRPECPHCKQGGDLPYHKNMTGNVGAMFHKALGGHSITSLNGVPGWVAESHLRLAAIAMRGAPETFRAMNPPNGWGSYESALETIEELWRWCREEPTALLVVSQ